MIELRVRELSQIFNSFDPSPFYDQDLATEAEGYIVDSLKELPGKRAAEIVVHVEHAPREQAASVERAIHSHFQRRELHLRRTLRDLMWEGMVSLFIGAAFVALVFTVSRSVIRGEGPWTTLVRESLLIAGWVALWRPLEIFLYRWWPLVAERRLYTKLAHMPVRLIVSTRRDG